MTTAHPGLLKTILVLMLLQLNADQDVTDVKTVLQAALLIQVLMSDLPNAALAMPATTHVNPVRNQFLVLGMKIKLTFIQPNVEHVVMNVAITQIVLQQKNPAHMAVLLQTPAANVLLAIQNHQYPAKNITLGKAEKPNPAAVQLHMSPTPMTLPANVLTAPPAVWEQKPAGKDVGIAMQLTVLVKPAAETVIIVTPNMMVHHITITSTIQITIPATLFQKVPANIKELCFIQSSFSVKQH